MATKKKGPVSSREAGEKKQPETADADAATQPTPAEPPTPGETVSEEKAPPASKSTPSEVAVAAAARPVAPPIVDESAQERHAKRRKKKAAHAAVVESKTSDRGDVSAVPEVISWRVQNDKQISLNQRPVLMRAGQVVSRLTHKLDVLRRQGVVLVRV